MAAAEEGRRSETPRDPRHDSVDGITWRTLFDAEYRRS